MSQRSVNELTALGIKEKTRKALQHKGNIHIR
jgi:hypothetical protein